MNKKYFLSLGAAVAAVFPIIAVVSCAGDESSTNNDDSGPSDNGDGNGGGNNSNNPEFDFSSDLNILVNKVSTKKATELDSFFSTKKKGEEVDLAKLGYDLDAPFSSDVSATYTLEENYTSKLTIKIKAILSKAGFTAKDGKNEKSFIIEPKYDFNKQLSSFKNTNSSLNQSALTTALSGKKAGDDLTGVAIGFDINFTIYDSITVHFKMVNDNYASGDFPVIVVLTKPGAIIQTDASKTITISPKT